MAATREDVMAALARITLPNGTDLAASGLVRALGVDGGAVRFVLEIDPKTAEAMKPVRDAAEAAVAQLPGVTSVSAVMTAHEAKAPPPDLKPRKAAAHQAGPQALPGVATIIAVASGKGGVGKSTVSANLAAALTQQGKRVGLLDADVYGPSQPQMFGVRGRPASPDGKRILPLKGHGVTLMSIGFMLPEGEAVIWRGPMLISALQQMLLQVEWGELDVLLVDLPPGTGDVPMTLAQKSELKGAVIVSTPQDIALDDARKGVTMFNKLNVPVLGVIENMSTHVCSNCGHEEHIFGHGGAVREAAAMGVPVLAEVPLAMGVRTAGDAGEPVVLSAPDSAEAQAFNRAAKALIDAGHV
ncbi:Mrp/NBP35 family ATP-binding protein [Pseudaestuariivita atlantica]|uniref:Iron-sulfur cluster carrier protein n=1 Tax=Pseudaestuariivita atlantica TaxID=1317121 RepID=A0A0L1JPW4_9RHOB|nr:Mrp/NBP35 family ATP-binding protein [Pseudaestuariivita atlantica]KNG93810.1 sodium:proton antiporter [Pseudaestuariivita atlantica]